MNETGNPVGLSLKDDGYAAGIFFGAEIMGSLKDCGCPSHPQGGLIWRMGYANAFAQHSPGVPMLHVDAGAFFSQARGADHRLLPQAAKQNEWVLHAYDTMNFGVANLTVRDLPYAERLFAQATYQQEKQKTAMLDRLISANVRARTSGAVSPRPFLIRELRGQRLLHGGKLRVGFIGLTDADTSQPASSVFTIDDPMTAAQHTVSKIRSQCDVLVVLAYLSPDKAEQLARQAPGIDLIVAANNIREDRDAKRINQTTIAYARRQTKALGEALMYLDKTGRLSAIRTRMVTLDQAVPRDGTAERLVQQADQEIARQ
jgi:2',3'-cyclic-nucleotide 2'-phosphodiesterase (5'-nucleotidase family)